jgi:hypothetical protein
MYGDQYYHIYSGITAGYYSADPDRDFFSKNFKTRGEK